VTGKMASRTIKPWNLTTFFFSQFPNTLGEREMQRIFQRWGVVEEVFIAQGLIYGGTSTGLFGSGM